MLATPITDPGDPRIADYRQLKERHLSAQGGRFIAESERVVRRLLASGLAVHSLLLTAPRLAALATLIDGDGDGARPFPIYVAGQAVMDAIAGFHVHRGCLAIAERPVARAIPAGARLLVVVEDLVDVDNLGAIARNAAAFGADALVLSPRSADPFYRKAIRVSLGSVFSLPVIRLRAWPEDLVALKRDHAFAVVGAALGGGAIPLDGFKPPPRIALLLGAEGPGLSPPALAACDHRVTIPMSPGADSLNVATAAAIFLYRFTRVATAPG